MQLGLGLGCPIQEGELDCLYVSLGCDQNMSLCPGEAAEPPRRRTARDKSARLLRVSG